MSLHYTARNVYRIAVHTALFCLQLMPFIYIFTITMRKLHAATHISFVLSFSAFHNEFGELSAHYWMCFVTPRKIQYNLGLNVPTEGRWSNVYHRAVFGMNKHVRIWVFAWACMHLHVQTTLIFHIIPLKIEYTSGQSFKIVPTIWYLLSFHGIIAFIIVCNRIEKFFNNFWTEVKWSNQRSHGITKKKKTKNKISWQKKRVNELGRKLYGSSAAGFSQWWNVYYWNVLSNFLWTIWNHSSEVILLTNNKCNRNYCTIYSYLIICHSNWCWCILVWFSISLKNSCSHINHVRHAHMRWATFDSEQLCPIKIHIPLEESWYFVVFYSVENGMQCNTSNPRMHIR